VRTVVVAPDVLSGPNRATVSEKLGPEAISAT
jgi:hypothetical protein